MTHLEKLGFKSKWLRRQDYDNGANMKGVKKGVQNRIEKYPRAFYVSCACHSLSLAVNDAASSCTETTTFFLLYKNFTIFFWFYRSLGGAIKICFRINSKTIESY